MAVSYTHLLRVDGGVADEVLDAGVEAFVRVMQQQVAGANRGENVHFFVGQTERRQRLPFGVPQGGYVETGDLKQAGVVEQTGQLVDLGAVQFETCLLYTSRCV